MRIVHAYKDFDPPVHGGIERHVALMCRFQRQWFEDTAAAGLPTAAHPPTEALHIVEALTCSRSWRTLRVQRDGTPVTEVGEWGRFQGAPVSPLYPWYLRRMRADVLVVHVPNPTAELGCLLARPRSALVVRYHSDVVRQAAAMRLYRPFLMQFLRRAAIIIPTSRRYLDTSPYLQPFREKCRVVPLGIIPEDFEAPAPDRIEETRRHYGGPFVFFCGRHRYYKGLRYLIEAAGAVHAPVVIAGEGPETPALRAQAARAPGDVRFTGPLGQDELVAHLHACAIFAFPSVERSEAFGIAILEAHACGKPVVATTLGTGVEFANLDGQTGYNVPPRDPGALAEALNGLLNDPEKARELGRFAKERVRKEFDARDIARKEIDLYRDAIECSKTGT